MALSSIFGAACNKSAQAAAELPKAEVDLAADKNAKPGETHYAVFAGGCFWCVEAVYEELEGVKDAVSGYAGGPKSTATYEQVCTGRSGHAEAVIIAYDPAKITYGQLLRVFFTVHNPTTKDQQGPDHGPQYRSAVFYLDDEQKKVAEAYIKQLEKEKAFNSPIVTTLEPLKAEAFYPAEAYHQNYAACNPRDGYIIQQALPKIAKVRDKFKDQLKPATQPAGEGRK